MLFWIFNVGHGFCALAIARNGNVLVFDCGHRSDPDYRPSSFLRSQFDVREIEYVFVTNYDEDHISDLPRLRDTFPIQLLYRNQSLSANKLEEIKREAGPITPAMEELLRMIRRYSYSTNSTPATPGISWTCYSNQYPQFTDTNNLSLVTFLNIGDLTVLIPGDLEERGWLKLLQNTSFQQDLNRVDVYVASHHGRESGYCERVFNYTTPMVVVFSDSEVSYPTQEMADTYASYATGVRFNGESRYVLSTRRDGDCGWRFE